MFYYVFYEWLFRQHAGQIPGLRVLNVFQYVTFRTAYAAITALLLSMVVRAENDPHAACV